MIQRIQSLYMLLTSLLSLLFLRGSILKFRSDTGNDIILNFSGLWQSDGTGNLNLISSQIPLSVIIIAIALLSLAAIFFYKNRKLQIKLAIVLIILAFILVAFIIYDIFLISNKYHFDIVMIAKMFIPLLVLILSILAYKGIKKDEDLVRSYDRLR